MATLEQARAAKAELKEKYRHQAPWKRYYRGIGIENYGTDNVSVSITLWKEAPHGLFPDSHDGVPVSTHVDDSKQELQGAE